MPIPGAKYRTIKRNGKLIRLAFVKGKVVEAKNLKTGDVHTPAMFRKERLKREAAKRRKRKLRRGRPETFIP